MRIRTLLVLVLGLAFSLIATRLVVLEMRTRDSVVLDQFQLDVERVSRDAASLLVLGQDYLLHASPRAARQWHAINAELAHTLPRIGVAQPTLQGNLATLAEVNSGLPELFAAIESPPLDGQAQDRLGDRPRMELLADQLVSETRRISEGAFELGEKVARIRRDRDQVEHRVTVTTMASFATLLILLACVVSRRVLRPMVHLERATLAMQSGNLEARSGYSARDEFGSLSRVFDHMAESLQSREATLGASNAALIASEASLDAARRDLRNILDAVPSMIGYWDSDLINRFANHAYHDWFGVEPGTLPGTPLSELLGAELYLRNLPHVDAVMRGEAQQFERSIPRTDGSGMRHSLAHYVPDLADGRVRGFYVLVHDITDLVDARVSLAAALRENEALLSTIRTHMIYSACDPGGRIVDVNDNFCRATGYRREELLGRSHSLLNSGVHAPDFWAAMWRAIARSEPWRRDVCNVARDGTQFWADTIVAPFIGADGRIARYICIQSDITPAKLAGQKLQASEAFLARAGSIAGVGGWQLDLRTQAVVWSAQTYRIHEVDADHQPDLASGLSYFAPEERATLERAIQLGMAGGIGWDLELRMVTARQRTIWVRTVGAVEFEGQFPVRIVGAIQDITARRQSDALLQKTLDRFALAAGSASIGVWEFDPVARTLIWDDMMYRLYGREPAAAAQPYEIWADSLHEQDRARTQACLEAALSGECDFDLEFRICRPDGETRHMKASARIVRDATGVARLMAGVNIDITERKRAEDALLNTSSLLEAVLDAATEVSIIATDPRSNITVFNAGAQKMLGFSRLEMLGHDALQLAEGTSEAGEGQEASSIAATREMSSPVDARERTYVHKDGRRVPVSVVTTPMHGAEGELLGYLDVARDVSRDRLHEASLRDAMIRAEQGSRAKSEFLANMSHEIRTPMNAVIGLSYLLRKTPLSAEQSEFMARIELASKSLLGVINDVLDLSKIEAGELTVEHAPFHLPALLKDLAGMMSVQSEVKGIELSIVEPDGLPVALVGDVSRLRQVLTNLLSNAIKFTDRGRVTLRVLPLGAPTGSVRLRFEVRDTGVGISEDAGARIFSPFVQADSSTTRRFGGTGLGLSIVKQLVQLMDGAVGFDSEPGQGSLFWVELPFGRGSQEDALLEVVPAYTPGGVLAGVRVLVVDDSDINLAVARSILELEGATIEVAGNGRLALDLLAARPGAFDAVLMDVQMPVMDGHEATRLIRQQVGHEHLPIIALTAGALSSERQRATAAGMDDFLSKPFHPRTLIRCIRQHVERGCGSEASALPEAPPRHAPPPTEDWPEVSGITTTDVRRRLGDDVLLFRSLLQLLLDEYSSSSLAQPMMEPELSVQAGRMHKLRGSFGVLGAQALHVLAGAMEAACRAGDAKGVNALAPRLGAQYGELERSARSVLERDAPAQARPPATPLDSRELHHLRTLLAHNSLSALDFFHQLAPGLRTRLDAPLYARVCQSMERLDFEAAHELLASISA